MLKTLIYTTLSFWILTLIQEAVVPFWLGDFIFLAIFVWSLYVAKYRQGMGFPVWGYWIPIVFGLGMAGFLFYSLWALLPYIIGAGMLTYLLTSRIKWIFRWKEGFGSILAIFLAYGVVIFLIMRYVMQYIVTVDFLIRLVITFILGVIIWGYMVRNAKRGKIR